MLKQRYVLYTYTCPKIVNNTFYLTGITFELAGKQHGKDLDKIVLQGEVLLSRVYMIPEYVVQGTYISTYIL